MKHPTGTNISPVQTASWIRLDDAPQETTEAARWLQTRLQEAQEVRGTRVVVLEGRRKGAFFMRGEAVPSEAVGQLIADVENGGKPVVVLIHGECLDHDLELAMAADYRLVTSVARLGLPAVTRGWMPRFGGTQRLPRLLGSRPALGLLASGSAIPKDKLEVCPMIDMVAEAAEFDGASASFVSALADKQAGRKLTRHMEVHSEQDALQQIEAARNKADHRDAKSFAARFCAEALHAAATRPFDEGLVVEQKLHAELASSPVGIALRHVRSAEATATSIPGLSGEARPRPVTKVAVIGAGTMGGGIAMSFANAGFPVVLLDTSEEGLTRGIEKIRQNYGFTVAKGKLAAAEMEQRMTLIQPSLKYQDLADCDLVVEAVFETMQIKLEVFRQLDAICKPGAVLCTNTSTLDVDEMAASTSRPHDVVGLHFFSPANVMKLVEIVRGKRTADDVLLTAQWVVSKLRKISVVAGVCDGFIGNRMVARYNAAANRLIVEGATPQMVDDALQRFGFPMGPCRMGDLAGLDIGWLIRKRRAAESSEPQPRFIADALCEAGRLGQKSGAGWYRYEAGNRTALVDAETERLVAEFRQQAGVSTRDVSEREVVERAVFALINEGARILEERIAIRASDIDVVYVHGYGFPAREGGPMYYADQVGIANVVDALTRYAEQPGAEPFWRPAKLLVEMAESGSRFADIRS